MLCSRPHVDLIFEYCLAKVEQCFPKGDILIAASDLCRAFLFLTIVAIWPLVRLVKDAQKSSEVDAAFSRHARTTWISILLSITLLVTLLPLSWTRMQRFRKQWQDSVFYIYLASS